MAYPQQQRPPYHYPYTGWFVGSTWSIVNPPLKEVSFEAATARCKELNSTDQDVLAGNSPFFPTKCSGYAAE